VVALGGGLQACGQARGVGLPILGLRAATPLPTPWGSLELDLGLPYVFLPASVLDGQGDANAGFAPPPVQVKWCIQTLFCLVDNSDPQNPSSVSRNYLTRRSSRPSERRRLFSLPFALPFALPFSLPLAS
jgi:hypothetical protein